jgi:hypothetical protein
MTADVKALLAVGLVANVTAPTLQAAKSLGPDWHDAMLGLPISFILFGSLCLVAAGMLWLIDEGGRS